MKNDFSSRLSEGLIRAKMSQVDLSKITGISKSAISQYLSGAFKPKQDRTYVIARALHVEPAWLMGYDVPATKIEAEAAAAGAYKKERPTDEADQSETKQKLHEVIDQMTEEDAAAFLQILNRKTQ